MYWRFWGKGFYTCKGRFDEVLLAVALSYVLLNVEPGSEEKVLNEVRKVPNVKECHRVYGVYDMIARIEADSMDALKEIVTWKIRRLDGVRSTLTAVVIE
jgi:DNA-binding Lrp family transcriptional regulator